MGMWNKKDVCLASVYAPNAVYPRVKFFNDLSKNISDIWHKLYPNSPGYTH